MAFSFTLTDVIPAAPGQIYDAWLDNGGHTAMTGSAAEAAPTEGASFTAWGGYISGRNLTLEPGRRIVQAWRTTRFTADDPDSQIEVLLEPASQGTRLTCTTPTFRTATPATRMADGRSTISTP
jgi:uncharacterized protein YndB with AHSA1/START domain